MMSSFMRLKDQILAKLKECQKDYYSRKNAVEAYQILTNNVPDIDFNSEKTLQTFERNLEELKHAMTLVDKDLFAKTFASACLNISLAIRLSSTKY